MASQDQADIRNRAEFAVDAIDGALTQLRRTLNDEEPISPDDDFPWIVAELRKAIDLLTAPG